MFPLSKNIFALFAMGSGSLHKHPWAKDDVLFRSSSRRGIARILGAGKRSRSPLEVVNANKGREESTILERHRSQSYIFENVETLKIFNELLDGFNRLKWSDELHIHTYIHISLRIQHMARISESWSDVGMSSHYFDTKKFGYVR